MITITLKVSEDGISLDNDLPDAVLEYIDVIPAGVDLAPLLLDQFGSAVLEAIHYLTVLQEAIDSDPNLGEAINRADLN